MAGELSPDKLFYWDGQRWTNALSADGYWRWDGAAWRPAAAPTRRTNRMTWLVSAVVVASLVVGGFGVYMMSSAVLSRLQQVTQNAGFNVVCASPQAKPGAPVTEGDDVCGGRLGTSLFSLDCTSVSGAPTSVYAFDSARGGDWLPADISAGAAGCGLHAEPDHAMEIETSDTLDPSAVAIADFVPVLGLGAFGVRVACTTSASCIDFSIYSDGTYSLDEGRPNDGFDNLTQGRTGEFGPVVNSTGANRVIVRVRGHKVTVFVNGTEVTSATTQWNVSSGNVSFYLDNGGNTTVASAQLQRLFVYQAL